MQNLLKLMSDRPDQMIHSSRCTESSISAYFHDAYSDLLQRPFSAHSKESIQLGGLMAGALALTFLSGGKAASALLKNVKSTEHAVTEASTLFSKQTTIPSSFIKDTLSFRSGGRERFYPETRILGNQPLHNSVPSPRSNMSLATTTEAQNLGRLATEIYAQNKDAIVMINAPFSQGTGFFVREDGLIATNYHVAMMGPRAMKVSTADGATFSAELVARDKPADLAIVRIKDTFPVGKFKTVRLESRELKDLDSKGASYYLGHPSGNSAVTISESKPGLEAVFHDSELLLYTHAMATGSKTSILNFGKLVDKSNIGLLHHAYDGPESIRKARALMIYAKGLAATPGASGSPMFNSAGRVISVFSHELVDGSAGGPYVSHLQSILKALQGYKEEMLSRGWLDVVTRCRPANDPEGKERIFTQIIKSKHIPWTRHPQSRLQDSA